MSFVGESWSSRLRQAATVPSHLGSGNELAINLPMEKSQGSPIAEQGVPLGVQPPVAPLQFEAVAGTQTGSSACLYMSQSWGSVGSRLVLEHPSSVRGHLGGDHTQDSIQGLRVFCCF